MGAGQPPARRRPGVPPGHHLHRAATRTARSGPSATRSSRRSAPRTWSTCARPTSTPAACSPPPTCRRSRRSGPGTSRPRCRCRGRRRPTRTARSSPTTTCASSTATAGLDGGKADHRVLPHRRALLAHLVRAAGAARPLGREELRRFVDRVRLAGRRTGRARRRARLGLSGDADEHRAVWAAARPSRAPPLPASVDLEKETVITGVVRADGGDPVGRGVRAAARRAPASSPPRW